MSAQDTIQGVSRRRGAVAVFVVVSLVTLLGFAALAVDVGRLYVARSELQSAADAAALAGAWELVNEDRLKGPGELQTVLNAVRQKVASVAGLNPSMGIGPLVDLNYDNSVDGDVVLGHLNQLTNMGEQISVANPAEFNTVLVRVRRDPTRNGPIVLWFARVLGLASADLVAEGAAAFQDGIEGYEPTEETGPAQLLPLALRDTPWNDLVGTLLGQNGIYGDDYTYDQETHQITEGPDGIPELNLYPGAGDGQLPPGNFGTVDIGPANNSTADISRQILHGISAEDFAHIGGELNLADGPVELNGDTGLSAAIKDELEAIKKQPRGILIFDHVSGPGENAVYNIVQFVGIRIMDVKLTGPMSKKRVLIQPAVVIDGSTTTGSSSSSYNIYHPVCLVR